MLKTLVALAGLFLTSGLVVASSLDLRRTDPVPNGTPIPTQDFFRPLLLSQPVLNDAGTHVAALITIDEDKTQLLVDELETQKIDGITTYGNKDIIFVSWLDDSHLIFNVSSQKIYGLGWMTAQVGKLNNAYPILQYCGAHLVSVPRSDRMHPLFWLRSELDTHTSSDGGCVVVSTLPVSNAGLIDLYDLNATKEAFDAVVECNGSHIKDRYNKPKDGLSVGYLCDKMGGLAYAFTDTDGRTTMHWLDGKRWKASPLNLDDVDIVSAGDKPGQVAVVSGTRDGKEPRSLKIVDAITGQQIEELLKDKTYDFDGWLYRDPVTHNIIGAILECETPVMVWFNEDYKALQKLLNSFFPGVLVRILDSDPDLPP